MIKNMAVNLMFFVVTCAEKIAHSILNSSKIQKWNDDLGKLCVDLLVSVQPSQGKHQCIREKKFLCATECIFSGCLVFLW